MAERRHPDLRREAGRPVGDSALAERRRQGRHDGSGLGLRPLLQGGVAGDDALARFGEGAVLDEKRLYRGEGGRDGGGVSPTED